MDFFKKYRNQIYLAIAAAAILAAVILGVGFVMRRSTEKADNTGTVTTIAEKEKKDKVLISVSTETIRDGLSNMGFLITQEYYFTQVEKYTKETKVFFVIPSSSEFMYSYDGSVFAGVDFEKIGIETDEGTKTITVEMPASEIQAVTIDRDTFMIYSEKDSLWNPLKLEDYNISLSEFEDAAEKKAIEGGILERSDAQAEALVREFIQSLPNTQDYTVEFR